MPAAAFVPWLLTDDPYYLEGAQATALYGVLETNLFRDFWHLPCVVNYVEPRGWAWGLRDLFGQAELAPESAPSWLQNRAFWQSFLPDNLAYANKYLAATASPCTTVFGLVYPSGKYQTFMYDYIVIAIARAVWSGKHPDWRPVLEYVSRARRAMSDPTGKSGWDHRFQTPYLFPVADARLGAAATGGSDYGPGIPASPNTPTSWAELWSCFCKYAPSGVYKQPNWTDPATWPADQLVSLQRPYLPETRGALAALSHAGIAEAKAAHDWLKVRMDRQFPRFPGLQTYKWAIPAA